MVGASGAISAVFGAFALDFRPSPSRSPASRGSTGCSTPPGCWPPGSCCRWMAAGWRAGRGCCWRPRRISAASSPGCCCSGRCCCGDTARPRRSRLPGLGTRRPRRARAAGGGGRRHISSRHRRPCAGPRRARPPRPRHSCRRGRPGRSCRGRRIQAARVLDPAAEHQMKLAHSAASIAGRAQRRLGRERRRAGVAGAFEDRAQGLGALLAGEVEFGEPRAAGFLGRRGRAPWRCRSACPRPGAAAGSRSSVRGSSAASRAPGGKPGGRARSAALRRSPRWRAGRLRRRSRGRCHRPRSPAGGCCCHCLLVGHSIVSVAFCLVLGLRGRALAALGLSVAGL